MTSPSRFRCPACNFPVFNRRVVRCESCAAELPARLLFSAPQLAFIDAEHARNEKARVELARGASLRRSSDDGSIDFEFGGDDGGGAGGDGGGGD
jgi:hypothetical protein